MPNKALRILIADEQHFYRLKIERALNHLGYYRIAPMYQLVEVLSAVEYSNEPLDLLIINASLAKGVQFDLLSFCIGNPQIRHAMIYDQGLSAPVPFPVCRQHNVLISASPLPDIETLTHLMAKVVDADPLLTRLESPRTL
ncbi:response regulator [Pseudomonas sp. ADAK18]|uniref:response regulator n=1 Tax=Pseudomonas sp. ADAK18 TaxID=2730848 RepID=UPI00146295B2|nr:response regulator [Pseudomonas sp. ADAK18]QJI30299.1 response regulator [Pseudomonas sp. ADAK18]